MAKKGDMLYAWTNDAALAKKAECGGAVTELLKYALESKTVDAVLAVTRGVDLYDAVPVIVSDAKSLDACAGSLHCGTVLLSKLVLEYAPKLSGKKIGLVVKGCDMMGILELAARKLVNLDNIVMIGVNCGGSVSPVTARRMIKEKYGVDPNTVTKEEIDKGQF
ncbi:MAG: formate dehydrogenase, partial [Methanomicrobiales archaeon]|nr:formate dehydrogenase [Methanomicrobiales archaeon]